MPKTRSNRTVLIVRDRLELGMLSESEARELLAARFLRSTDLFQHDGSSEWKALAELQLETEAHGERQQWFKQASDSISSATAAMTTKASALTGKVASFVSAKKTVLSEGTHRVLEDYIPEIRKLVAEQLIARPAKTVNNAMRNEDLMRNIFGARMIASLNQSVGL